MIAKPSVPKASDMMRDVLYPDDGMPKGGRGARKLNKANARRIEGKAYTDFEVREKTFIPEKKVRASASEPTLDITQAPGHGDSGAFKPRHFLQCGFGLGDRADIIKCFGANFDCATGPGEYDNHTVGSMRWLKEEGNSHPGQMTLTNHKSCKVCSFGKPKTFTGPRQPPLTQAPGPGHYPLPNLWDPVWQRYPSLGKSFVRQLPPPGESRFGGLARQELRNANGEMNFIQ